MITPCSYILAFDVSGTVADWHRSVAQDIAARAPAVDAGAFARDWRAGYRRAIAAIAPPNPASLRFHKRPGFEEIDVLKKEVGYKLGCRHDIAYYQGSLRALAVEPLANDA